MTDTVLLCGEPGPLVTGLAECLARGGEVRAWAPGQPVPDAIGAAVDAHVVDTAAKSASVEQLDAALAPDVPILVCCHADSVTHLSASARHPERFSGFGLLPPFDGRETVECARGLRTNDPTAQFTEAFWLRYGLEAVWVGDSAGLVTARVVACLANEAAFAVMERTALPEDVDRAMELGTGYPRGPLAWAVLVGLDHVVAVLDGLTQEHGDDRYRVAPMLRKMALAGHRDWVSTP